MPPIYVIQLRFGMTSFPRILALAGLFGLLFLGASCKEGTTERGTSEESSSQHASATDSSANVSALPVDSLSQAQRQRLGSSLRRFLTGDTAGTRTIEAVGERDGEKVYSVLIQSSDPEALREVGLPITSVVGETVTARLTVEEILKAASQESVQSIRADKQLEPHK